METQEVLPPVTAPKAQVRALDRYRTSLNTAMGRP